MFWAQSTTKGWKQTWKYLPYSANNTENHKIRRKGFSTSPSSDNISVRQLFCLWFRVVWQASTLYTSPRRLTFTWWGCHGLCLRHKLTELAHSFLFCSCVCFCLYGPFNFISFLEFSRQLSVFSLCPSGHISALLVLSTTYLFMKVSFSPDIIPSGCLGLEH